MLASDRKLPVSGGPEKRTYVRDMFTAIAPTYDRLNRVISLGLDQRWRRYAVGRLEWERAPEGMYLDLCSGSAEASRPVSRRWRPTRSPSPFRIGPSMARWWDGARATWSIWTPASAR